MAFEKDHFAEHQSFQQYFELDYDITGNLTILFLGVYLVYCDLKITFLGITGIGQCRRENSFKKN